MTPKMALDNIFQSMYNQYKKRESLATEFVILRDLVAKAELMKPKQKTIDHMGNYWVCPVCNHVVDYIENVYCHNCGQALDWSNEK